MHCLGAVTGSAASPNGIGSRDGILSVFRALGVLVCEGRIQGPPRGYKEGPHCAPPMQAPPNDHACEDDNYLCDRYLLLVREIADRTAIGSFLCVEVLLCCDCACGLAKATCKNPVCSVPSLSISPWQQTSEMLLEYWCISVVPSKSPETMNFQGLYQAVRSRLHFSQVAAWWSRSNGAEPTYVATRVVPYNEDNLRKFRELPVEHTFPLAGNGDGNSIKVTVWALPRMEMVPILTCPIHPTLEKDEEGVARALTPTKAIPVPTAPQHSESLLMPALVDDRLQTPCDKPGKHHCRCEEEDVSPPSPSISRPNGERKRRRSLPCGPTEISPCVTLQSMPLPSVQESMIRERKECNSSSSFPRCSSEVAKNDVKSVPDAVVRRPEQQNVVRSRNNLKSDNLEHCFRTQLSIDEREGNSEKRYKRALDASEGSEAKLAIDRNEQQATVANASVAPTASGKANGILDLKPEKNGLFDNLVAFDSSLPWSFVESWNNSTANGKCGYQNFRGSREGQSNACKSVAPPSEDYAHSVDSIRQTAPSTEPSAGPSCNPCIRPRLDTINNSACTVHQSCSKNSGNKTVARSAVSSSSSADKAAEREFDKGAQSPAKANKELSRLMTKLSFPEEKDKAKDEGGLLEWFSRVPGRVLGVGPANGHPVNKTKLAEVKAQDQGGNEVKFRNCNLELSQREFDEVLAVLRARTPSGRRRTPVKTVKRCDRSDKSGEDGLEKNHVKCTENFENGDWSPRYIVHHAKTTCEGCGHKFCKRREHQFSEKTAAFNQTCGNKNIYHSACQKQEKLANSNAANDDLQAYKYSGSEKQASNIQYPVDCFQTVSNKADVLLGAILRTSKERNRLPDSSNGTKPRTVLPTTKAGLEYNSRVIADKINRDSKSVSSPEDEKSLPLSLNKRLNRFRQLFKKEDKKMILTPDGYSHGSSTHNSAECLKTLNLNFSYNKVQPNLHESRHSRDSRAKRRIEFPSHCEENHSADKSLGASKTNANGAHQKSNIHSTNYKQNNYNYASRGDFECDTVRDHPTRSYSTKHSDRDERGKVIDTVTNNIADKNPTQAILRNGFATSSVQNGYASSNIQCNNLKDGVNREEDETSGKGVPSTIEQERFRRSLENAASMVFHSRTGLPLTSSPAPLRRGSCCFDYDSSLNSVSSKRSALFELNTPPSPGAVSLEETDRETENTGDGEETPKRRSSSRGRPQSHALLGSFEESALNGRLEPVSTVHGFAAELGASGSFCPKHRKLPVTVFFYTLGDNDKVSTPYLAHINLGKKGYQVPRSGTIQVTLLNPLGTVVKMFVVLYDLSDMPPRSHTFLRQRTLRDKTLRYLVHLRFMSGKSGRIYLHTDIRMIICRKSDVDTASDFGSEPPKELRSYIHGPTNPKFSPRC